MNGAALAELVGASGAFARAWQPYGPEAGEAFPLLDSDGGPVSVGTGGIARARYAIVPPGYVVGYGQVQLGTGASIGSGRLYVLLPPVGGPPMFGLAGQTLGWCELAQDQVAVQHMEEASLTYGGVTGSTIPLARAAVMNPHRWHTRGTSPGAFNAFGQVTIAHGLGQTPDKVDLTMDGNYPYTLSVASKAAANFVVQVQGYTKKTVADGTTVLNGTAITSASAAFSALDVNQPISGTNIPGGTTIASVQDVQHATLSQNASAAGSGIVFTIGTTTPTIPFEWTAWAPINGANAGGLFVTATWPWTWGAQFNDIEWRFAYPLVGATS